MTAISRSRAPLNVRSRLPATGTSIFSVMSALAQQHGAVNLGQGFPDYAIDPVLIDLVTAAMRAGHNQYPLSPGVMALREAIAGKVERLYGHGYDPEHEVTVTTGATQAIFTTIGALAHPGDEVIVFEPAYDSYIPAVRLAGATPVPVAARGARLSHRLDRAPPRHHAAHTDDHRQHAEQPGHQRALGGRLRRVRHADPRHRHRHRQRRSLRAHGLRRPAARKPRAPPRARRPRAS